MATGGAYSAQPQAHVEIPPTGRVEPRAEAKALVEGDRRLVGLVRVEQDAHAAALAGALDHRLHECGRHALLARRLGHEQVLEPAILAPGPHAVPVAHLANAGRGATA